MSSSPTSSSSSSAVAPETAGTALEAPLPFTHLLDVVCPVNVLLGTGVISVRQCLALERRSILPLRQSAGEDL